MDQYVSSPAAQDYLAHIYRIELRQGHVRVAVLAEEAGVSQASVTSMARRLHNEGLVRYEKYRGLQLTALGLRAAQALLKREETLSSLFSLLEVEPDLIRKDAPRMARLLSEGTLEALVKLVGKLSRSAKAGGKKSGSKREGNP